MNVWESARGTHKQEHGTILRFLFHHQNDSSVDAAHVLLLLFAMAMKKREVGDENSSTHME